MHWVESATGLVAGAAGELFSSAGNAHVLVDVLQRAFMNRITPVETVLLGVLLEVAQLDDEPPQPTFSETEELRLVVNARE